MSTPFYDLASLVVVPSGYKASKVYAQKPQTTDGQLAFTRSTTATRVGPDGLIEKVRTNVILQSETFDNASWIKINATATANSTTAPNGTLTADTILAPLASFSGVYQTISSEGAMTLSVYAKANTSNFIAVTIFDVSPAIDYMAIFDLSNGTFIGNGGFGSVDSYSIENAGNGWYRLSVTKNVGAVGAHNYVIGVAKTGNSSTPVAGTSVFVWAAQVEASDFGATPYIPTTTAAVSVGPVANVPRLDYLGSSCGKLLLEPQRTNLATYSEQFDNAAWVKLNGAGGSAPVVTANYGIAPDGTMSADRVQLARTTTSFSYSEVKQDFGTSGTQYTVSVYLKSLSGTPTIAIANDGASFNYLATLTSDWVRYTATFTASGTASAELILYQQVAATSLTADFLVWGFQAEVGAYGTSLIPTTTAAVTRGADAASKTGISSLIGQTEGTIFVEMQRLNTGAFSGVVPLQLNDGTNNNRVQIELSATGAASLIASSGGAVVANIAGPTLTIGQTSKIAVSYKVNDFKIFVNGVLAGSDTSGAAPVSMSRLDLASEVGTSYAGYTLAQSLVFKTSLTNAQLAELTTI